MHKLPHEMITYILQYLPDNRVIYLFDNMLYFRHAICASYHQMNMCLYVKTNDRIDILPPYQFIICARRALIKNVINTGHRTRLMDRYHMSTSQATEFDPCFYNYYMNIITDNCYGASMKRFAYRKKYIDRLTTHINDAHCTLYRRDTNNIVIKHNFSHLILYNCKNVIIKGRISGHVILVECDNIELTQIHIDKLIMEDSGNCKFNNIYILRLLHKSVHNVFNTIDTTVLFRKDLKNNKFGYIRNNKL